MCWFDTPLICFCLFLFVGILLLLSFLLHCFVLFGLGLGLSIPVSYTQILLIVRIIITLVVAHSGARAFFLGVIRIERRLQLRVGELETFSLHNVNYY
jgi:hypothetical protein